MITGKNKHEYYQTLKVILEKNNFCVEQSVDINYGLQFNVVQGNKKGLVRIYESKKGIKYDLSQFKDNEMLDEIQMCINNQIGISNPLHSEKANKKEKIYINNFPDEIIGTDESGKGDFFGPLVVASVYVDKRTTEILNSLGVIDSKKLSENKIEALAREIKRICPFSVVIIGNEKYNELYSKINNLNKLLAWGHARAIENILEKIDCEYALSDQFGEEKLIIKALLDKGKKITLYQRPKAEEITAVAAASIIARNEYVNRLKELSNKHALIFPKGASQSVIDIAKIFLENNTKNELSKIAKLHFKTTDQL